MVFNDGAQGSFNGTRPHPPISPRTFFWVSTPAPHLSMRSTCAAHALRRQKFSKVSALLNEYDYRELILEMLYHKIKRVARWCTHRKAAPSLRAWLGYLCVVQLINRVARRLLRTLTCRARARHTCSADRNFQKSAFQWFHKVNTLLSI